MYMYTYISIYIDIYGPSSMVHVIRKATAAPWVPFSEAPCTPGSNSL